ncbi:hypothetical protein BDN72DRAFT_650911 [Pluteus cervinus]|uniref:Uncharacterized protein n=1 Tax=Pluteus cervinus TaxID=181527 RepID=A0ACD3ATW2_9AGAR|nr:hypothetical protein BDN72DRAFT_650911 [Pluteus cervinus]
MFTCDACQRRFIDDPSRSAHQAKCKKLHDRLRRVAENVRTINQDPARKKNQGAALRRTLGMSLSSLEFQRERKRPRLAELDAQAVASSLSTANQPLRRDEVPRIPEGVPHSPPPHPPYPPPRPPSPPPLPAKRRRNFSEKVKAMLGNVLPEGPGPLYARIHEGLPEDPTEEVPQPPPAAAESTEQIGRSKVHAIFKTCRNAFSITRTYHGRRPTNVPDMNQGFSTLLSDTLQQPENNDGRPDPHPLNRRRKLLEIITPYRSVSAFLFNDHFWTARKKTKKDRNDLLKNVLFHKDFNLDDLRGVNFDALDTAVVEHDGLSGSTESDKDSKGQDWKEDVVAIKIPTGKKETKASKKQDAAERRRLQQERLDCSEPEDEIGPLPPKLAPFHTFKVPGFYHRSLVSIVKEGCSGANSKDFHWHPFEEHWTPPWDPSRTERVHGELYTSPAFLEADRKLQELPPEPDCDLPRAIAALMFFSDATHVAQFGQAKLWPVYVYLGNQSKYDRGRPSTHSAYTLAFLPFRPADITEFIKAKTGSHATVHLLRHCKRELYQGCWRLILEEPGFLEAYEHGIVLVCGDQIKRRMYPRIFIASADYLEKYVILIVTIRDMGICLCPRCKTLKANVWQLGLPLDVENRRLLQRKDDDDRREKVQRARDLIYDQGYVVNSEHVEKHLKGESLVPTENAFSHPRLRQHGLDVFQLVVTDLMHELELGVWKALLQHLIRILFSLGTETVHIFNERFRRVAPFGPSTIRKFSTNVSDLSKLAARDYEDILQCIIPCVDGLLPEQDHHTVADLLYTLAYFHGLAKLRLHTDLTIQELRLATTHLGEALRFFAQETCVHFKTCETDKEFQARKRRIAAYNLQKGKTTVDSDSKKLKSFSLETSKIHALGDYADQISHFGTMDSYSTQTGESNHWVIKGYNERTNKNNAVPQITKISDITSIHARMRAELDTLNHSAPADEPEHSSDSEDPLSAQLLGQRYNVASHHTRDAVDLQGWLRTNSRDPALQNFYQQLQGYLLTQHQNLPPTREPCQFTDMELSEVKIRYEQIYAHARASFNYTTYDIRRDRDGININRRLYDERIRCNVMLPALEDSPHPYSYAHVLGVYHAMVYFKDSWQPERVDFLWVRWFQWDIGWSSGPSGLRLDRLTFLPASNPQAFGFIHPSLVIRPCHLIPAFAEGRTIEYLGRSLVRHPDGDWKSYYVNRFVDRDMVMRYLGSGIGHCLPPDFPRETGQLKMIPSGPHYQSTVVPTEIVEPEREDEVEAWFNSQVEGLGPGFSSHDNDDDSSIFDEEEYEH